MPSMICSGPQRLSPKAPLRWILFHSGAKLQNKVSQKAKIAKAESQGGTSEPLGSSCKAVSQLKTKQKSKTKLLLWAASSARLRRRTRCCEGKGTVGCCSRIRLSKLKNHSSGAKAK